MKTIVVRAWLKPSGRSPFVEFCTETMEFCKGDEGAHWGHGNTLLIIEAKNKKEIEEKIHNLIGLGFKEVETFSSSRY